MNKIDLISEEEFKKASKLTVDTKDEHALQLNRIQHELEMRKNLASEKSKLNESKTDLEEKSAEAVQYLNGLPEQLKQIREVCT